MLRQIFSNFNYLHGKSQKCENVLLATSCKVNKLTCLPCNLWRFDLKQTTVPIGCYNVCTRILHLRKSQLEQLSFLFFLFVVTGTSTSGSWSWKEEHNRGWRLKRKTHRHRTGVGLNVSSNQLQQLHHLFTLCFWHKTKRVVSGSPCQLRTPNILARFVAQLW